MNDAYFKPSLGLESILGPDIAADSESFVLFLKAYYEWLQSTRITLTDISGTFVRGEEIVGETSKCKAKIEEVGDDYLVVRVTTRIVFNNYENIEGQTSSATATISTIKDNVVRETGNLINYRNIDTSIDQYVEYLRDEMYENIPLRYFGDKRLIATKFRSFFESRSNEDSFRFLFKLLYNENIDFYYPGEDVLRVSDGNFEKTQIIRVAVTADIFDFLNRNIRGTTSNYFANVVDIKTFFVDGIEIAEFTLKLVSGTFQAGETIVAVDDNTLDTTIYGIVSGFEIVDAGSGYEIGDEIVITGDGAEAKAVVSSIKESPISALQVNQIGYGYQLGTQATINNSGTGGSDLVVRVTELTDTYDVTSGANTYTVGEISRVQILNRGSGYFKTPTITLVDNEIAALGLLSPKLLTINNAGSNYGVGNTLNIVGGSGANAAGIVASVVEATTYDFLFEDGQRMVIEGTYEDILKNEEWNVLGAIARIELTNFGDGYTNSNLPTITVNSTTGSSANLVFTGVQGTNANVEVDVANNITGIGSIREINVTNFGIGYTSATANTAGAGDGNANVIPIIAGLGTKEGVWIDDDGKIDYKYIQDSYFYQDFSYSIKSGLAFSYYRDLLKQILHPAGFQAFGEILIKDFVDVSPIMSTEIETLRQVEELVIKILTQFTVASSDISAEYRLDVIPNTLVVSTDLLNAREINVEINPTVSVSYYLNPSRELRVSIENYANASPSNAISDTDFVIATTANTATTAITGSYSVWTPITGLISSNTGQQYGDFLLSTLASTQISALEDRTFDEYASLIVGNGTFFTSDFIVGDKFYANNQLFTVALIFDDVTLLPSEVPDYAFTDVQAYKIAPA